MAQAPADRTKAYALDVVAGRIVAGPHVRNACRRHLQDLIQGPERGLFFDHEAADYAFRYFENVLMLSEGQFEGRKFELHPSQAFIIGSLFGWKGPDGLRRFHRAYIEQGMELGNDGNVVSLRFLTSSMEIVAPNGAAEGMEWRNGYLRVWKGAAQRIIGPGFGANGDNLIDYFGPNVGAAAASKSNAMMWMDANGSAYFGGQLSAGVLRNAVQTTTTQTIGTELVNGPFATNGRVRTVRAWTRR